jgi:hypothetical protein
MVFLQNTIRDMARRHGWMMEEDMYAYNLFRSTQQDGLVCAVPEERSVPAFVTGPQWQFGGRLNQGETPLGFDKQAAMTGVRFNGFYLFASFPKESSHA